MRQQGLNSNGEEMSSMYVERGSTPSFDLDCSDLPSLTRQEFAEDCDINTIMSRFETTGVISHYNSQPPAYLDVTDVPDLAAAISLIRESETAFMALPAKTRAEFDNDPVKFIHYAEDPENIERMREWGLAPPAPKPPEPQKVEIVNPPAPPAK